MYFYFILMDNSRNTQELGRYSSKKFLHDILMRNTFTLQKTDPSLSLKIKDITKGEINKE